MALRKTTQLSFPFLSGVCLIVACSGDGTNDPGGDGDQGDGDMIASGGLTGDGGLPGSGGNLGTGGDGLASGGASGGLGSGGGSGGVVTGGQPGTGGDIGTGGEIGTGGAPPAATYTLSAGAGVYTYSLGSSSMMIDPANGGRVTSFIVEGQETLVQSADAAQFGSVFWPSPQTLFQDPDNWPPPPEIDSAAYAAAQNGDELTLTSPNSAAIGLTVMKTFSPTYTTGGTPAISVVYTMSNTGASPLNVAGWEISRVGPGGMAFYPTGPAGQTLSQDGLMVTNSGGHSWYAYNANGLSGTPKIFADGMGGWLAWSTGAAIAIKSFPDVLQANFAPGEAEIEIYADVSGDYFEVEQQGPVQTVAPGTSATWAVLWVGVDIPDGADTSLGSADLVSAVTGAL